MIHRVKTIEDLEQKLFNVPAHQQIKTLVYIAEDKPVLVLLRGDDTPNEAKLTGALGTTIFRPAEAEEINQLLGRILGALALLP